MNVLYYRMVNGYGYGNYMPFTSTACSNLTNTAPTNAAALATNSTTMLPKFVMPSYSSTQIQYMFRPKMNKAKVNKAVKCDTCAITLNSEQQAQQHYSGKNHLRKLKQLGMPLPVEAERKVSQQGQHAGKRNRKRHSSETSVGPPGKQDKKSPSDLSPRPGSEGEGGAPPGENDKSICGVDSDVDATDISEPVEGSSPEDISLSRLDEKESIPFLFDDVTSANRASEEREDTCNKQLVSESSSPRHTNNNHISSRCAESQIPTTLSQYKTDEPQSINTRHGQSQIKPQKPSVSGISNSKSVDRVSRIEGGRMHGLLPTPVHLPQMLPVPQTPVMPQLLQSSRVSPLFPVAPYSYPQPPLPCTPTSIPGVLPPLMSNPTSTVATSQCPSMVMPQLCPSSHPAMSAQPPTLHTLDFPNSLGCNYDMNPTLPNHVASNPYGMLSSIEGAMFCSGSDDVSHGLSVSIAGNHGSTTGGASSQALVSQSREEQAQKLDPVSQAVYDNMLGKLALKRKVDIPRNVCDMMFSSDQQTNQHLYSVKHLKRAKLRDIQSSAEGRYS